MTQNIYSIAVAILVGISLLASLCLKSPMRETSLAGAWKWGIAAKFAWLTSCVMTAITTPGSPLLDQFWLWTAILSLCPFIAALGARRPTNRVWSLFIILPLLAVLGWPALTVMVHGPQLAPIQVQAPVCVGFVIITVMGVGNYIGTRYTLSAILAGLAIGLCLIPLTTLVQMSPKAGILMRGSAGLLWAGAVFHAIRQRLRMTAEKSPFDRLWFDFRDTFGIVWALRIQERLNETAEKEGWSSRLGPNGFDWDLRAGVESQAATREKMEHALRWHLRRFVDPEWIDRRLCESGDS